MRGEQFYRSQKKETSSLSQEDENAWKISLHSPFARFLIDPSREKFPLHRKERILSSRLPLLRSKPKNNKAKVADEYSIPFPFYFHVFLPPVNAKAREKVGRRAYTYGVGWRSKEEMSTSVEITRRPVGSDTLTRRCRVLERAHATGRCADWQERPHFTSIAAKIYDSPGGLARP